MKTLIFTLMALGFGAHAQDCSVDYDNILNRLGGERNQLQKTVAESTAEVARLSPQLAIWNVAIKNLDNSDRVLAAGNLDSFIATLETLIQNQKSLAALTEQLSARKQLRPGAQLSQQLADALRSVKMSSDNRILFEQMRNKAVDLEKQIFESQDAVLNLLARYYSTTDVSALEDMHAKFVQQREMLKSYLNQKDTDLANQTAERNRIAHQIEIDNASISVANPRIAELNAEIQRNANWRNICYDRAQRWSMPDRNLNPSAY